ncbi:substrate-specific activator of APC-dependent proteolysis [Gryganskiella cystojenkinii]|nr:substrate-specific activator of APC-dependent proteolysis [Gryganskiella cystojenkinii]
MKRGNSENSNDSSPSPDSPPSSPTSAPLASSTVNTVAASSGTGGGPIRTPIAITRVRTRAAPGTPTNPSSSSSSRPLGAGERIGIYGRPTTQSTSKDDHPERVKGGKSISRRFSVMELSSAVGSTQGVKTNNNSSSIVGSNDSVAKKSTSLHSEPVGSRTPVRAKHGEDTLRSPGMRSPPPPGMRSPSGLRSPPGLKSPIRKVHYDRYIPAREGELAEKYSRLPGTPTTPLMQEGTRRMSMSGTPGQGEPSQSQTVDHHKRAMHEAHDSLIASQMQSGLSGGLVPSKPRRLFEFSVTTTQNTQHHDSPNRQIYQEATVTREARQVLLNPTKSIRQISKVPFKILDAPELRDDFYLNLVDWSSQNVLGVGLGSCVYLWSALTSTVNMLCDLGTDDSVTSINWISRGTHIAVGTESGAVQLWDVQTSQRVRTLKGHASRVGVLAWNDHTLTSGSRDRNIYHRDVRAPEMWQQKLVGHVREVCGLKWSSNGTQLASGGNDNKLMVWGQGSSTPTFTFNDHTAAVKAIDWSPHESNLLASGGGTADRHIRFWNTSTGTAISATDTGSQVCNLAWSKTSRELVSTHGYSQNQVLVWKYPQMQQLASLPGHGMRVLYLALSPDGQTIVTGAGDETLRFWNVFQKSKAERTEEDELSFSPTATQNLIR